MIRRALIVLVLVASAATSLAAAHELFIKMDSYFLPPDAPVRVPILNGTFGVSENSITPDRVADISIVFHGRRSGVEEDAWTAEGDTTFLDMHTQDPGTYVLGVSTRANDLELTAADFNEYLEHDGILDALEARTANGELEADVTERYSKHVKAIYQVGDRRTPGINRYLGYPAELIPVTNPYEISVGGRVAFRVLVDDMPVAGQLVYAGGEGQEGPFQERSSRTDEDGEVRFTVDAPGRWYVRFIHMAKTEVEGIDYESKWATVTFEIR